MAKGGKRVKNKGGGRGGRGAHLGGGGGGGGGPGSGHSRKPQRPPKRFRVEEKQGGKGKKRAAADLDDPDAGAPRKRKSGAPLPKPEKLYRTGDRVLIVGDGDLSFSAGLLRGDSCVEAENLVATVFDTKEEAFRKYPDAEDHADTLEALGAVVAFGVDATRLTDYVGGADRSREFGDGMPRREFPKTNDGSPFALEPPFDVVSFHFPHLGLGDKDEERSVLAHSALVRAYLEEASKVVDEDTGRVQITVKKGPRYEKWGVVRIGTSKALGLKVRNCLPFRPADYPGYRHRRTIGYADGVSAEDNEDIAVGGKTYIFDVGGDPNGDAGAASYSGKGGRHGERGRGRGRRPSSDSSSDD